ncbi:threonine--tRNA ligase [Candidatus Babeliales bacterium]|nr:threonine--tRNA ligase [Candidatus Babeliales bacterium]
MKKGQDLSVLRHSAAHLLAHAVSELYPNTKFTLGPATETGFFYDMLPETNFKESDLPEIEKRMHEISERNLPLEHTQISKKEACSLYKDNQFKLEMINNLEGDTVGLATQGAFFDLCRGGHVDSTGDIKFFKLTSISGSYWRADRNGVALQRITGTAFYTQKDMRLHEKKIEEALKYDHRRLGKELDLFSFKDEGVGFPFFHPKGKQILNSLVASMRKRLEQANYKEVETPLMLSDELWKCSGHYEFYKDNMYFSEVDEKSYAIKPMNCPGTILIYKDHPRSYRELPLRLYEFGKVHRHELSGVLHGLFRVRAFTIDDTHIYCTQEQIEKEILTNIGILQETMKKFGFDSVKIALSTRPENAMGSDKIWADAIAGLKNALKAAGADYVIQEGEGAFYGPKLEFKILDSMGREWQCGTIQLDFFQAENFDLTYVAPGGTLKRPVIIHQAIYGSLERFLGIIIEHYKGNLPFWLAPVQAKILTITDEQKSYAHELYTQLKEQGVRVEIYEGSDPLAGQIKDAQMKKIPWMLIIGNKEVENKTVTLRHLDGKQEFGLSQKALLEKINQFTL